jgi:hypothetical protein
MKKLIFTISRITVRTRITPIDLPFGRQSYAAMIIFIIRRKMWLEFCFGCFGSHGRLHPLQQMFAMPSTDTLNESAVAATTVNFSIGGGCCRPSTGLTSAAGGFAVGLPWFVVLRAVCYWIILVVGIVGNLLVLAVAVWRRNRKQVSTTIGTAWCRGTEYSAVFCCSRVVYKPIYESTIRNIVHYHSVMRFRKVTVAWFPGWRVKCKKRNSCGWRTA